MPVPYTCIHPARQHFAGQHGAYPELFALIGNSVPGLRGLFLWGHGGDSAALGVQQGNIKGQITGNDLMPVRVQDLFITQK